MTRLPVDRKQKKQHGKEGEKSKNQQEVFKTADPIDHSHDKVKTCLRGDIGVTVYKMHKLHILCIVVPHIQPAGGKSEQKQKDRYQTKSVQHLLPADSSSDPRAVIIHQKTK